MKLAIIGYGSMGMEVEKVCKSQSIEITDIFDIDNPLEPNREYYFDVGVDFTFPHSVLNNVTILAKAGKNIVLGTTGWGAQTEQIAKIVEDSGIGLVYASNFSLGMNLYMKIIEFTASIFDNFEQFDIMLHELHHKRKKDSPSGTALKLAEIIIANVNRKKSILPDTADSEIEASALHVSSTRGGEIAGTHTVYIDSEADTIELTHRAKNRTGFAYGAVAAASWIYGKKGLFQFQNVIEDILSAK